jgi:hypothetical protein
MALQPGSSATTTTLTTAEGAQTVRLAGLHDCEMLVIKNLGKPAIAVNFDESAAPLGPGNMRLAGKDSTLTLCRGSLPSCDTFGLWAPTAGQSVRFEVWR